MRQAIIKKETTKGEVVRLDFLFKNQNLEQDKTRDSLLTWFVKITILSIKNSR